MEVYEREKIGARRHDTSDQLVPLVGAHIKIPEPTSTPLQMNSFLRWKLVKAPPRMTVEISRLVVPKLKEDLNSTRSLTEAVWCHQSFWPSLSVPFERIKD